jgi:hypothetical protein
MLIAALAVLAFQQTSVSISIGSKDGPSVRIRSTDGRDSSVENTRRPRIVATSEQLATAFADAGARSLLATARAARLGQDSSIRAYDASTVQRFTVGMGFSKLGRERIFFRHEGAARVRWARGVGARIDVTGKRSAVPMLGGSSEIDIESLLSPVPYYPGRDALWFGFQQARDNATDEDIVHPLATSAEAVYTYKTGDSLSWRLPNGDTIRLRELEVRPRRANWHAVVGSLWFDARSGQLVRAAYRLSQPLDLLADEEGDKDSADFITRAMFRPATATISGVAVEYGLYQGRFWLPRSQVGEGNVRASFMRMPIRIEEHFTYESINALDTAVVVPPPRVRSDSMTRRSGRNVVIDSARKAECDSVGSYSVRATRHGGALPVIVRVPCDTAALAHSPALPASIFAAGEEVFGDAERDALLDKAMTMMPDLPLGPRLPRVEWGFDLLRYNRVEGLSSALDFTYDVNAAYTIRARPRFGIADRIPNGELSMRRTTGQGTTSLTGYRRLSAANDWGNPLDFGSGLSALLFGRDEGFYYRAGGAELNGDRLLGSSWQWRVFHELQSDAVAHTSVSLAKALGSSGFDPALNITAARVRETGAALRNVKSFGLDPRAFRLLSDLRIEGAAGDSTYGRGALDLTLSHPIGSFLNRSFSAAITAGAGTSVGELPVQRDWFLGGTSTIRGQPAGIIAGNSYWLTRTEVGYGAAGFRRIAFFDLGWAGDRTDWKKDVHPASGAGIGWSFMDGLVRADIARGLYPRKDWRGALYLEAKF